jgi:predicted anti-sigma-YlaC factor YlaD
MPEVCSRSFDERLLSGYLDGELTQAESQRVRLHLEDCATCRGLHQQLLLMKEASMSTPFATPDDEQWDERPRSATSRLFRGSGWLFVVAWLVGSLGFALWTFLTEPGELLAKLMVVSAGLGIGLLFLSVLLDRLRSYKSDRYRRVEK